MSISKSLMIFSATTLLLSATAFAQTDENVAGHPRVNEVDQRLENQQQRINNGVADGQLNATQATHLENRDANVAQHLSADEAKHNGHITKKNQKNLNKKLNKNSRKIDKKRDAGGAQ